jgi:NAD(P)H-hydrate epimerase
MAALEADPVTNTSPERYLYRAARVRELDRRTSEALAIPSFALMKRAGAAAFRAMGKHWPELRRLAVLCGSGNNAGDGYVIAALARAAGITTQLFYLGDRAKLKGDAHLAAKEYLDGGGQQSAFAGQALGHFDLIVDALLGTGLERPLAGTWRTAVEAINAARVPVLAVDIPSGLSADTGMPLGDAVRATLTVSFVGLKRGLFTGAAPAHCGEVQFDRLGAPAAIYAGSPPDAVLLDPEAVNRLLTPRPADAHKGHFGHVLVIGGNSGLAGAGRMAAQAAGRTGAGLVSLATRREHAGVATAGWPEIMGRGVEEPNGLAPLVERATVLALGPGLGQDEWAQALWERALMTDRPLVLDADALHLLARHPRRRDDWILTPHPGEASRLLGISSSEVQRDRYAAVAAIAEEYGGVCVLKGAGSLICAGDAPIAVCNRGNPGMASGGMGDVLTGVIAGFVAQGMALADAARAGVWIHAGAGDAAAAQGERGLLATDLLPHLRRLVNPAQGLR